MKLVYCINAYPRPQSRTLTILGWLAKNQIKHIYVLPGFRPSLNKLFRRFLPSICSDYYQARLIDGLFLALSIYPSLIWQSIFRRRSCVIFVCFESWELYPFLSIYRFMRLAKVVVDLGYPAADISAASLPARYIERVTSVEQSLNRSDISLLVESEQQCTRVRGRLGKPAIFAHFVLESTGLADPVAKAVHGLPDFLDPCSRYILFRGTLNMESGIPDTARSFSAFREKHPDFSLDLIIHGSGELKPALIELLDSLQHVYYFSDFLEPAELSQLMRGASAIVGQFNLLSPRPFLTIPHKFVESLRLGKLYLTPFLPPTAYYLEKLLDSGNLLRIKRSRDPIFDWLSILHEDVSLCESPLIQAVSMDVLDRMGSINHRSLTSSILS
jgi:glycosyltransferase involved in cell wall biosynthesis